MKKGLGRSGVRKLALARDRCCLKCGTDKCLVAHHILPKSLYPELEYELENFGILCLDCHVRLHKEIPLAFMVPEGDYFKRWLKG